MVLLRLTMVLPSAPQEETTVTSIHANGNQKEWVEVSTTRNKIFMVSQDTEASSFTYFYFVLLFTFWLCQLVIDSLKHIQKQREIK